MKAKQVVQQLDRSQFTDEMSARLADDASLLEKVAAKEKMLDYLKQITPALLTLAGSTAIAGTLGYQVAKSRAKHHQQNLDNSYHAISPSYRHEPAKFHERFSELSVISPTVASNPKIADTVIKERLHSGFNLDDVHRLASIEYHTAHSPKVESPSAVAKARALGGLEQAFQLLGPSMVTSLATPGITSALQAAVKKRDDRAARMAEIDEQIAAEVAHNNRILQEHLDRAAGAKKAYEANKTPETQMAYIIAEGQARKAKQEVERMNKGSGHMDKESSSNQRVSDECLGRMLGDAHLMAKTAAAKSNVVTKAFKWLKPGAENLGEYFQDMAVPLAIGVGIKAVHSLMQQKETESMGRQADAVFSRLKQQSDVVKGDPGIAQEAFDALRSFAPALAVKPMIAKTFVEHVVTSGGKLPPDSVQQLANTQTIVSRLNDSSGGTFVSALKEPMSLFGHSVKFKGSKDED